MTTTKDLLELKIEINKKVFQENAEKIKQKIDNLHQEYLALESSYNLIEHTLKSELLAEGNQEVIPKTSLTLSLPKPVRLCHDRFDTQNQGKIQEEESIELIDLTTSKKERQRCKYCKRTFPDITSCKIHTRNQHETNIGKTKTVNYFPSKRRNNH